MTVDQPIDLTGRPPSWPVRSLRLWQSCLRHVDAAAWSTTPPPLGHPALRLALARELGAEPDEIVVTSGVRAGAQLLSRQHEQVLIERPTFRGVVDAVVGVDRQPVFACWGEEFLGAAEHGDPLCWVTSPLRNPDGRSLDDSFAGQLAALARSRTVVVNEVYRWSCGPQPPFGADVLYVGSLSKVTGGGVRLGWVRGARAVEAIGGSRVLWSHPPMPWQEAWSIFVDRGGLDALHDVFCARPAASAQAFVTALPPAIRPACSPVGTPHLLLALRGRDEAAAARELGRHGLVVGLGRDFCAGVPSLRFVFTSATADEAVRAATICAEHADLFAEHAP